MTKNIRYLDESDTKLLFDFFYDKDLFDNSNKNTIIPYGINERFFTKNNIRYLIYNYIYEFVVEIVDKKIKNMIVLSVEQNNKLSIDMQFIYSFDQEFNIEDLLDYTFSNMKDKTMKRFNKIRLRYNQLQGNEKLEKIKDNGFSLINSIPEFEIIDLILFERGND